MLKYLASAAGLAILAAAVVAQTEVVVGDRTSPLRALGGDGNTGISDFLQLLALWGPCGNCNSCPADLDGDCDVGITDFLQLLANWG